MTPTIEAHGLVKRFRRKTALDGLDLEVESGQVMAVLGPNGAGKTTFVRCVSTLLRPDDGVLRVVGHDARREPGKVRKAIGLAGQYAAVEPAMTGRENLELVARLFGQRAGEARANATRVLERFGLADDGDRLVRTYSGGMRRKLDLGASLVSAPRLLLLDEPTTGLDPRARLELWDNIDDLAAQGTDVLLTTQYLDEADRLASHLVIINRGRVVASGPPSELKQRVGGNVLEVHVRDRADTPAVAAALARLGWTEPQIDEATRRVSVGVGADATAEQLISGLRAVDDVGTALTDISLRQPKLDEVFLALTGRELESPPTEGSKAGETVK
ncbi:daunorubicin resistance protein DrrA family ABC transporter ATP-binding protein [Actinoallomurus liliacearum]|uniref:Daunorubicin resistance protein DrrA family ABC transporter ATP-binding protein n=1 Tax=Actinoallomurus liliacearum TaxID=1080073 RepID=A0ABP8TUQ5_9ACTN